MPRDILWLWHFLVIRSYKLDFCSFLNNFFLLLFCTDRAERASNYCGRADMEIIGISGRRVSIFPLILLLDFLNIAFCIVFMNAV